MKNKMQIVPVVPHTKMSFIHLLFVAVIGFTIITPLQASAAELNDRTDEPVSDSTDRSVFEWFNDVLTPSRTTQKTSDTPTSTTQQNIETPAPATLPAPAPTPTPTPTPKIENTPAQSTQQSQPLTESPQPRQTQASMTRPRSSSEPIDTQQPIAQNPQIDADEVSQVVIPAPTTTIDPILTSQSENRTGGITYVSSDLSAEQTRRGYIAAMLITFIGLALIAFGRYYSNNYQPTQRADDDQKYPANGLGSRS